MHLTYEFEGTGPQLSEHDLEAFEGEIGTKLPPDFRSLLLVSNGGYPQNNIFRYGDDYSFVLQELFPLGEPSGYLSELRVMNRRDPIAIETLVGIPNELLVIGLSQCGDYLCLGIRGPHHDKVFWINHEERDPDLAEEDEWLAVEELAPSFRQFMEALQRPSWKH